jgi:hypothetical protein
MNKKCCVCAAVVFFVFGVLPVSFYFLRGRKELSVDTKPESPVQGKSPVLVQTDNGAVRLMENVTYVSSPGHSVFSVLAFLLLAAMCTMLVYYVYIKFRKWKRAQARAAAAQQQVVVGAQQVVDIPPVPAVPAVPQDHPPSYSAAELQAYRDRIVAHVRREGYSGPSRNRRRRREPAPEMDCPHHFDHHHGEDEGELEDMEAVDSGLNRQRARHRVQSPRDIEYRSTESPGTSQGSHPVARPRLSDTEVMREFLVFRRRVLACISSVFN